MKLQVLVSAVVYAAALSASVTAAGAQAAPLTGKATVVDTSTIEIGGKRILLYGVESINRNQTCSLGGKLWECWAAAVRELQTLVDQGPASCDPVGDPDLYGRVLARCTIGSNNLNQDYVASGYGLAKVNETKDYAAAQKTARLAKAGLWQGKFQMPADFRLAHGIMVDRP